MSTHSSPSVAAGAVSMLTDGTVDARIEHAPEAFGGGYRLTVRLPIAPTDEGTAGRYFLVRCGAVTVEERLTNWQMYARQPLFAGMARRDDETSHVWDLLFPPVMTPGHRWLLHRPVGSTLNLIGPLGNGFTIMPHTRNLLLVGRAGRAALLLPMVDAMLDRGGRVTLLLVDSHPDDLRGNLLPHLPIAVEVQMTNETEWPARVAELAPWADQLCAALPNTLFARLATTVRQARLRFDPGFAFVLADADLLCGYGACLACVVPTASGGMTRACVHGPVFDLHRLSQA